MMGDDGGKGGYCCFGPGDEDGDQQQTLPGKLRAGGGVSKNIT